jgi:hypothetical protein
MYKSNKTLSCLQIVIIICLMVCNKGIAVNSFKKTGDFSCKGHQCGCKSEYDCKKHCCCAPTENIGEKQKNGFQSFISSINCKAGNNSDRDISFSGKYLLVSNVMPVQESLLCFLSLGTSIRRPDIFASPPEKPPRRFI